MAFSWFFLLLWACQKEEVSSLPEAGSTDGKVKIEIFTRAGSQSLPSIRSLANETEIEKTPWILVFKGPDANAVFEEAVQATEFDGIDKRYIILTEQTVNCQLLILANSGNTFYDNENGQTYAFNAANLTERLSGKTLTEACAKLRTESLSNPQVSIPFSGGSRLPMSDLLSVERIDKNTKIESNKLKRITAKIVIENKAPNFTFKGIVAVVNAPQQSLIHRLAASPFDNDIQNVIEYNKNDAYSTDISIATPVSPGEGTTANNPIYLYESKSGSSKDTYLIIRGDYNGKEYFYKMALVNNNLSSIDILRNHLYTFTITSARSIGFTTIEDVKLSKPSNIDLDFRIRVSDEYSHEMVGNNDYYLGISNSHYIAYTDEAKEYTVASFATDCTIDFPNSNTISIENLWDSSLELKSANRFPVVTSSTTNPVTDDINVLIQSPWIVNYDWAYINLKLGNLPDQKISMRCKPPVEAAGAIIIPTRPGDDNLYAVSGNVVENEAKNWIKLTDSSDDTSRNDADNIIVEDGVIHIHVLPNSTNQPRYGTVYINAGKSPNYPPSPSSYRMKLDIKQKGI